MVTPRSKVPFPSDFSPEDRTQVNYGTILKDLRNRQWNNFAVERYFLELIKADCRPVEGSTEREDPLVSRSGGMPDPDSVQAYYDRIKNHDLLSAQEERDLFERRERYRRLLQSVILSLPSSVELFVDELGEVRRQDRSVKNLLAISKVEKLDGETERRHFETMNTMENELLTALRQFRWADTGRKSGLHRARHRILETFRKVEVDPELVRDWGDLFRNGDPSGDFTDDHRRALEHLINFLGFGRRYYRDRIVRKNLRLVFSMLDRFKNQGLPEGDLIQEGNIGLLRAIEKFEYQKGYKFSTYATWWIRQAMQRAIHDKRSLIRIPSHRREELSKLFGAVSSLKQRLKRDPEAGEIADELNWPREKVDRLLKLDDRPLSLNQENDGEDDRTLSETIGDPSAERFVDDLEEEQLQQYLEDLLGELSWRREQILRMRFGLDQEKTHTFEKIGELMDLSKERVRQLEQNALDELRDKLESDPRKELFEEVLRH